MQTPIVLHRASRLVASAVAVALAAALGGCGSIPAPSWDPTDLLNFLDNEKRTPGERKPVFPEGVPGISQGVPPEMMKGNTAQQPAADAAATATVTPPVETQPSPPPARRARTAKRPPAPDSGVEIAPDDVNVGEEAPPTRRQAPQQPNPFPAPPPR